jgi:hypothetical protein
MAVGNQSGAQYLADLDQRFFDTLSLFRDVAAKCPTTLIEYVEPDRKPIAVVINGERIEV